MYNSGLRLTVASPLRHVRYTPACVCVCVCVYHLVAFVGHGRRCLGYMRFGAPNKFGPIVLFKNLLPRTGVEDLKLVTP